MIDILLFKNGFTIKFPKIRYIKYESYENI
jgi:hypothetical protein